MSCIYDFHIILKLDYFYEYTLNPNQHKLTAARLKKNTAQGFRLANSARIFINLCWYDYINMLNMFKFKIRIDDPSKLCDIDTH